MSPSLLLFCVLACLTQNAFASCGCDGIGAGLAVNGLGLAGGYGYSAGLASGYGYGATGLGDYSAGCGQAYGGFGIGNVAVAGELPVAGTTLLAGQVPIIGAVKFGGPICATGVVTIAGSCACGCSAPGYGIY